MPSFIFCMSIIFDFLNVVYHFGPNVDANVCNVLRITVAGIAFLILRYRMA